MDADSLVSISASGPATPSEYFNMNITSLFLSRFFNLRSRIKASFRESFLMDHINFQGEPDWVAFSSLSLCLFILAFISDVCPL